MIKIVDRIILVGTSHISKNSILEIKDVTKKYKPDVIGIELDTRRFKSLMSETKEEKKVSNYKKIKELGTFGFLFAQVAGFVQKKVGGKIDVEPGVDMKGAYEVAREHKIPTALIDLDIKITLNKLSKISFFKKIGLISSILFKSFKKEYKELLNFDLKNVPEDEVVIKMIEILKKETPVLYKVLIEDRNKYMVKRLMELRTNHSGYIVAVVGAGHVEGMSKLLKKELYKKSSSNISFSFQIDG